VEWFKEVVPNLPPSHTNKPLSSILNAIEVGPFKGLLS
jgi:hypothetical protein